MTVLCWKSLSYKEGKQIVSEQVSKTMRTILEKVVSEGGGKKAYIEGYHIGGKTATSETLPRSANKYISSFLGFVPAEDPRILGICIINNPQGVYYGGTICAPVMRTVFENILPYLGIEKEAAQETDAVRTMVKSNICCLLNKTEGESFPTKIKQLRKKRKSFILA